MNFTSTSILKRGIFKKNLLLICLICLGFGAFGQVTTSSITGVVKDEKGEPIVGSAIRAIHTPSGTAYANISNEDGRFTIPNMRIGGPYEVSVSFVGYKTWTYANLYLKLGEPARLNIVLVEDSKLMNEVEVVYQRNALINADKNGPSTNISNQQLNTLPTLNRSITDFTKLTPQLTKGTSGPSFAGMDDRFNNLTIDGSIFNNSFGLQSLPGSQTNSTPISLDAIDQIQVNIAPYDVRQGGFAGAGINAVTRSGTNELKASAFYNLRNENFVGTKAHADSSNVLVNAFDVKQVGFRIGGPILRNKLFFFLNGEMEKRSDPGTTYYADNENGVTDPNETRVKKSTLDALSNFLIDSLKYNPGAYQGYSFNTTSYKALARIDYNINDNNKFSLRYNYLRSFRDVPVSNSGGFNGRRDNFFAITYANSNYVINNDIHSIIGELNSTLGKKISNNIIFGYTANRDYRSSNSAVFPLVDILEGGRNLVTFGYEPFTPNNVLNTDTWQAQDNVTFFLGKHTIAAGAYLESFKFTNTFTPTLYGQFVFNSLSDFYTSARAYLANPNGRDTSVTLNRYNLSYSAIDGGGPWSAITKARQIGAYLQDEWEVKDNFRLTYGVRIDVPFFSNTAIFNPQADTLAFKDEDKNSYHINTAKLPGANPLFSPRIGFNWDVMHNQKIQIRGGVGLFSGRPAFVWISNQVGNNGMLSGQISAVSSGTAPVKNYPFNPNVIAYVPTEISRPAKSYNIAYTDPNFKFPQVLRGSLAIDHKLPWNLVASLEGMYQKTISDVGYVQANLVAPNDTSRFKGPDNRLRYPGGSALRINSAITDATVLKNTGESYAYFVTAKLEKSFSKNWYAMAAYNFGEAKDVISAGSIAFSSWRDNLSVQGNNYPDLAFSSNDQRHRIIGSVSYRVEYLKMLATTITLFGETRNQGRFSYVYSGDLNFDGVSGNDLLYIPANTAEMNFADILKSDGTVLFTADQQKTAFENYIKQDDYLKNRRGQYAERNGALLPWISRIDLSLTEDVFLKVGGKKHTLQFRWDVFNLGNLMNPNWGVGYVVNTNAPLRVALDKTGKPIPYTDTPLLQMNPFNSSLDYKTTSRSATLNDVWQMQFGIRYIFD